MADKTMAEVVSYFADRFLQEQAEVMTIDHLFEMLPYGIHALQIACVICVSTPSLIVTDGWCENNARPGNMKASDWWVECLASRVPDEEVLVVWSNRN